MRRACAAALEVCFLCFTRPSTAEPHSATAATGAAEVQAPSHVGATPLASAEARPRFTWKSGLSLGIVGTTYVTAWVFVSAAWWTNKDTSTGFAFRDEGAFGLRTYAGGADKLGHFYSNYLSTRMYTDILGWGGLSRGASMVSATLLTTAFFTAVEVKDGYEPRYGFSVTDMVSNLLGQGTALGLMLVPSLDDAVSVRLMYFPSRDFFHAIPSEGALNIPEDYSGQTYLLSFHLAALPIVKREGAISVLRYLDVSLGYGTRGFKPVPRTPEPVRQLISVGLSLNLQSFLDDLLDAPREPRAAGAAVVHFTNEVYQVPYTRLPIFTYERLGPPASRD
jgi:hypothetical protein